ncbi:MAG: hypothetical protein IJK25_04325, partial [Firmicutes bacterium]|nr:hypothetical protein [Bacillota bacterium]
RYAVSAKSSPIPGPVKSFISDLKREKLEMELSESLAYVKNLVILGRGKSISAELLLTELSDVIRFLSPVFLDMAHWLHLNEKEKAAESLSSRFGTGFSKEIGHFLSGWEDIDPSELLSSVELFQSALREERMTRQMSRDEAVSDLAYFPVVINCMAVLLNFIYVAYFIAQKDQLGMLMG